MLAQAVLVINQSSFCCGRGHVSYTDPFAGDAAVFQQCGGRLAVRVSTLYMFATNRSSSHTLHVAAGCRLHGASQSGATWPGAVH